MMIKPATIQQRWSDIRAALDSAGFDALLVSDQLNFGYLTGRLSREFEKRFRHLLFMLDRDGGAHALLPASETPAVTAMAPPMEIETYPAEPLDPEAVAAFIGRVLGPGRKRLGIEAGGSDRPGMAGAALDAAIGRLPALTIGDASPILARARLLKSEDEIVALTAAGRLAQDAWEATLGEIRPGMALIEIFARLASAFATRGADYNFPGHIEVRNATSAMSPTIGDGEILWCDFGVTVDGYHSDIGRRAVIGGATRAQQQNHGAGVGLLHSLTNALQPGRRIGDCMEPMLTLRSRLHHGANPPARFGHGIGLGMAEMPSLRADETTMLEPGMVLTPEPSFTAFDSEFVQLEEMVAVTSDGPVPLTHGADILYRAG